MKTSFFKRHLSLYLSTALVSCSSPSFAVKKVPNSTTSRQMLKHGRRKVEHPDINNIFTIPEDKKQDFYIRKRKIHKKSKGQIVYGIVIPNILKNWKNPSKKIKLLSKNELLPSTNGNPCSTLYPFLVASLLRFAPYLLKPYEGGWQNSPKTYYLSFAHIFSYTPNAALILPRDLPKLNENLVELRDSLDSLLSKVYHDESGNKWTALELANITVYLHAAKISANIRKQAIKKLKTILDTNNEKRDISDMIDPLIDIVCKTSRSKVENDTKKPLSKAYKKFYLDIVKVIDPLLRDQFKLKRRTRSDKGIPRVSRFCENKTVLKSVDQFSLNSKTQVKPQIQSQVQIQLQPIARPQPTPQTQDQVQINPQLHPQNDDLPSLFNNDDLPLFPGLGFGGFGRFGYMDIDDMNF